MQHIRGHRGFHSSRFVKNDDATPMFLFSVGRPFIAPFELSNECLHVPEDGQ